MQAESSQPSILKNRLLVAMIVFVIWIAITMIGGTIASGGQGSLDDLVKSQIGWQFILAALFLLGVVSYFHWQHDVGLKPAEPRSWRVLWLPALFIVAFLGFAALFGLPPFVTILFVLFNTLVVGVSEELMFRGIMFSSLLPRFSIWLAIIITCALFGAVHALNGFITGDFGAAFVQALAAGLSGLWLMAVRIRTRSLYPAILIHGLWDFAVFIFALAVGAQAQAATAPQAASPFAAVLFVLPLALYGLWLLRGVGKRAKEDVLA